MATDLIEEYLAQLRRTLRDRETADDVCAEVEDHLREAADRLELQGVPRGEAQRRTLACFGDAGLVARSFALAAGVPSRTSRLGGTAALVGAAAWAASALVHSVPRLIDGEPTDSVALYFGWAGVVLVGTAATVLAVIGMFGRAGRERSGAAFVAYGCCAAGVISLALFTWGWSLGALFLTAAAALGCAALHSCGLVDRWRDALLISAWPLALVVLIVTDDVIGIGPADSYGDHPAADALAYLVGAALFALGLMRLGRRLSSEPVADLAAEPARLA